MMKGLLLKDFYMLKKELRAFFFIIIFFTAFSLLGENNSFFLFYGYVMMPMATTSLISYEERYHWDKFLDTTPVSRKTAVTEKYLLNLLLLLIWSPVILTLGLLRPGQFGGLSQILCIGAYISLFLPALILPFIFALGSEKGRLAYYVFIFAAMAGLAAGVALLSQGAFVIPDTLSLVLLIPPVAVYIISWRLSIALYKKRSL